MCSCHERPAVQQQHVLLSSSMKTSSTQDSSTQPSGRLSHSDRQLTLT